MNLNILNKEVQRFITENLNADIVSLLFKKSPFLGVSIQELAEQIESKSKSKKKLPTWFSTDGIYYPNKLNISQTSSEVTAAYKTEIIDGKTLMDVTGGFGVDAFAFSKKIDSVYHFEENELLSHIADYNFKTLGIKNVSVFRGDGINFLLNTDKVFDWIYIDPSRRTEKREKVFFLSDCTPDVTQHLNLFFSKSPNILIKTGPLLDINVGIQQLKNVREIHVVAVNNEVKELLWVLKKEFQGNPVIKTVDLSKTSSITFEFTLDDEKQSQSIFSYPENYLYEPNSAILKSGAYKLLGERFGLKKLHQHSHIYTSKEFKNFPGRVFKINKVVPFTKKALKSLNLKKANITTRNFPVSVAEIRKKTKWGEGGDTYLFFTKNHMERLWIISCVKT